MRLFKLCILILITTLLNNPSFSQKEKCLIVTLNEHSDQVHSVAFSPDGSQFITGSKDETIKIWDFNLLKSLTTLKRHYATIYELEYTSDGEHFLSGGDKTINIWKKDGSYIKSLSGHITSVWSFGISQNGQYAVSGSFDNNFRIWDINKGETIHIFKNGRNNVLATTFSKATNLIACGSKDGFVEIYTFDDFEFIHSFSAHGSNIYSLAFSNDGKYLASASRDNVIKIWDLEKMEIFHVLTGHERSVMSIKFSSNDRYLVSASYDASVRLWDVESGEQIYSFLGHKLAVNDVDISTNNQYIISGASDNTIKIWEINPEILASFYFEEEFQNELSKSGLFVPKKPSESRAEYKKRLEKSEIYKKQLYQKYLERLNKKE